MIFRLRRFAACFCTFFTQKKQTGRRRRRQLLRGRTATPLPRPCLAAAAGCSRCDTLFCCDAKAHVTWVDGVVCFWQRLEIRNQEKLERSNQPELLNDFGYQESGGLLLLDEDWAHKCIAWLGINLAWDCFDWGNQCSGCDRSNASEGWTYKWIEDGGNMWKLQWNEFYRVLQMSCVSLHQSIWHSLGWTGDPRFQVHDHHHRASNPDIVPISKISNHQSTPCISWCCILMPWPLGWTMTKSQSLKVERWWSLIRPRTECELFVSGFHFAVFHWISIDPSLVYF